MVNSIAGAASGLSQAQMMQQYAVSMTKNAMDTTETLAQGLLEMLPQQSQQAPSPYQFDVYA